MECIVHCYAEKAQKQKMTEWKEVATLFIRTYINL